MRRPHQRVGERLNSIAFAVAVCRLYGSRRLLNPQTQWNDGRALLLLSNIELDTTLCAVASIEKEKGNDTIWAGCRPPSWLIVNWLLWIFLSAGGRIFLFSPSSSSFLSSLFSIALCKVVSARRPWEEEEEEVSLGAVCLAGRRRRPSSFSPRLDVCRIYWRRAGKYAPPLYDTLMAHIQFK